MFHNTKLNYGCHTEQQTSKGSNQKHKLNKPRSKNKKNQFILPNNKYSP